MLGEKKGKKPGPGLMSKVSEYLSSKPHDIRNDLNVLKAYKRLFFFFFFFEYAILKI